MKYVLSPVVVLSYLLGLACNFSHKQKASTEEPCYFIPPDKTIDSIRANLKIKRQYFEEYFASLHQSGVFNGNVIIAEKGKIIFMGSFGKINYLRQNNLHMQVPFQLASVSKIFTAIAILQLVEKGLIQLDDKVKKYIPLFPYENITVYHLLSHRSGLPRYDAFTPAQWNPAQPMTNKDMANLFAQYRPPLYFKPGKRHDYSNTNYAFLALIIEHVSNQPFNNYMKEQIFNPAGMHHAFVLDVFAPPHPDSIALGHQRGRSLPTEPQHDYLNGVVGDKGIYASAIDLFKFDIALYQGTLLQPQTLQLAYQRTCYHQRLPYEDYGLGHRLKDWRMNGQFIPYHSGWWRGFKTLFIRDIFTQKTIIMLCNQDISPPAQLIWNLLSI